MKETKRERERETEAGRVALKGNRALTYFTVEWPPATPDPLNSRKSASVYACVRNPLLFSISLSCVSCSLPHCSATSNPATGGWLCTFRTEGALVFTHLCLGVHECRCKPWIGSEQISLSCCERCFTSNSENTPSYMRIKEGTSCFDWMFFCTKWEKSLTRFGW